MRVCVRNSKHAHLAKPCTLMFYSYDFHYKNPGFLTETGVSDFLRRQEVHYHTAAKAVDAVNMPLLKIKLTTFTSCRSAYA